jgi:hypothetical protein
MDRKNSEPCFSRMFCMAVAHHTSSMDRGISTARQPHSQWDLKDLPSTFENGRGHKPLWSSYEPPLDDEGPDSEIPTFFTRG